jgi:hypothetical protein
MGSNPPTLSDVKVDGELRSRSSGTELQRKRVTIAYTGELKGDELTLTRQGGGGGVRGACGGGGGAGAGGGAGRGGPPAPIVLKRTK